MLILYLLFFVFMEFYGLFIKLYQTGLQLLKISRKDTEVIENIVFTNIIRIHNSENISIISFSADQITELCDAIEFSIWKEFKINIDLPVEKYIDSTDGFDAYDIVNDIEILINA